MNDTPEIKTVKTLARQYVSQSRNRDWSAANDSKIYARKFCRFHDISFDVFENAVTEEYAEYERPFERFK